MNLNDLGDSLGSVEWHAWLDDLPYGLRWLAVRGAFLAHAYWIAIGLTFMLSAREVYLSILALTYVTEPIVWLFTHTLLVQLASDPSRAEASDTGLKPLPPTPPCILTLLSWDFTLEVELCGAFLGFLAFHAGYYSGGFAHLGSRASIFLLGIAAPLAMVTAGVWAEAAPLHRYGLMWGLGLLGGALRAAAAASLFSARLGLWERVLHARYDFKMRDTIVAPLVRHGR